MLLDAVNEGKIQRQSRTNFPFFPILPPLLPWFSGMRPQWMENKKQRAPVFVKQSIDSIYQSIEAGALHLPIFFSSVQREGSKQASKPRRPKPPS
jgi:hypothetical protein